MVEATLPQIHRSLMSGEYIPSPPTRYELAKSHGSYRIVTVPNIRDALVYRLLCDEVLELALPSKAPGAFFSRHHAKTPVGRTFSLDDDPYLRFFDIWLRYQEYRTQTMMNQPYEVLVVSDITNFFDSISHDLLFEYLSPLGLPRKAVGLLGRILEVLKPTAGHSPNPGLGIPVDEYDCSRQLAHVFLFEHDHRMASKFGEENYVRWMDDQNVGTLTETAARRVVNELTRSLSSQRLTLNAAKTLFLAQDEVIQHFQLDANGKLTQWDERFSKRLPRHLKSGRTELEALWQDISASPSAHKGHWDKILKRVYAFAAKVDSPLLDERMYEDMVNYPDLHSRIMLSLARRNEGEKLLNLFTRYCGSDECLFEATEAQFFEACLFLDATPSQEREIRKLASDFAKGKAKGQCARPYGKASALLCLYWFNASANVMYRMFCNDEVISLPSPVVRAWAACIVARVPELLPAVQAKLVGNPSSDVARLSNFLSELFTGTITDVGAYRNQKSRWPKPGMFYDARAWLQLELIAQARSPQLASTARSDVRTFARLARTRQELRALKRITQKLR